MGKAPARIWVFPDTAVPDLATAKGIRDATRGAGRWVRAGRRRKSVLEDLGFTPAEADAWQRDVGSGNPARVMAARNLLEKRIAGRDPREVEALIASSLRRD